MIRVTLLPFSLDLARAEANQPEPMISGLARALLEAAEGDAGARFTLRRALAQAASAPRPGVDLRRRVVACLACDSIELVPRLLAAAHGGLPVGLELGEAATEAAPVDVLPFAVDARGRTSFTFPRSSLGSPHLPHIVYRWLSALPVFAAVAARGEASGAASFNLGARQKQAGLVYCANRPAAWLIPDPDFLGSEGYANARQHARPEPWETRRAALFWRGNARDHVRVAAALAQADPATFDAAEGPPGGQRAPVCRYALELDPTAGSASLFAHLLGGTAVLRAAGADLSRLWFEARLRAWTHYVPVAADLSDLAERLAWLCSHDAEAREIAHQGREAALAMAYEPELALGAQAVAAALRA